MSRWTGKRYGPIGGWYVDSGLRVSAGIDFGNNRNLTNWRPNGVVAMQGVLAPSGFPTTQKDSPPWLWGVTDQTEPTMPVWMKDDAKWQAALDAQK